MGVVASVNTNPMSAFHCESKLF